MDSKDFVDSLRQQVLDPAVSDTVAILKSAPGRQPRQELVEASKWYNGLDTNDQSKVNYILNMVAQQSVFGVLSVLDGSRQAIREGMPNAFFELRHIANGTETVLSGPNGKVLHELL